MDTVEETNCEVYDDKARAQALGEAMGIPFFTMKRFLHDRFGGTYLVHGVTAIPFPAWLCCVTHDVTGEHPERIFVHEINHYNK